MASLTDIREQIAAALALPGFQVSAYMLSNPTPPAAHVFPDQVEYDQAMQRGLDVWTLTVQCYVGFTTDIGAQKRLDELLAKTGSMSVKQLIETDRTLCGIVHDCRVTAASGYRLYSAAGDNTRLVLGAEWTVQVFA